MKMNIKNMIRHSVLAGLGAVAVTMVSCNPEPDESDLYTFTGETIASVIAQDNTLTAFNKILERVGYDKMMAAYGSYTCFAPINDGVSSYCDSLYNDKTCVIPHNGMTQPEGSTSEYNPSLDVMTKVEWLSDSLCLDIAKYHISNTYRDIVSMTGNGDVSTMLGYQFSYSSDTGKTVLEKKSTIVNSDNQTTNGLLHIIDQVIPRYTLFIGDVLDRNKDRYSIFAEAFRMTGLDKCVLQMSKMAPDGTDAFKYKQLYRDGLSGTPVFWPANGVGTEGTMTCKVRYTLFAEPDDVMRANGINDINDLIKYANDVYGNAPSWYDYMSENGITVSTGKDYTNRFNALNMFVAYHILYAGMSINWLVFEKGNPHYNYKPDADSYDYYETMLPHTMLKIWEPVSVGTGRNLYINRYIQNNTLTNELATQGTESIHAVERPGVLINRGASLTATNGYIHALNGMLVYDRMVPKGVLNERMRVNCTSLFPELINNFYRTWSSGDGNIPSGHDVGRMGIPAFYFDNAVFYNISDETKKKQSITDEICFNYNLHSYLRCYQSDQMQYWGKYDWAFRLPPVPTGVYEIRIPFAPMSYGSFMQYYIGNSSSITSMKPFGLPFDARIMGTDPRIGMTNALEEDDMGVASDIALHNRGYMRGPYSYYGGTGKESWTQEISGRYEWTPTTVRMVLGRIHLNQGEENWLRVKTLDPNKADAPVGLDYVELVPVSVLDNQELVEDWY